jgi:thiazole synthase ThiGH ThiG subunit
LLYNEGFHSLLLSGSATVLGMERMKRQHRTTVVNERLRDIIAQVESTSDTNHLKLLEPSQPVQMLPNTSRSGGEDKTPNRNNCN